MVENKVAPQPADLSADARAQAAKKKSTMVEEGTEFSGKLKSSCPLVVRGRVQGEVEAPSVTIAQSGSLTGTAKLGQLFSEGELSGQFDAEAVRLAGRVGHNSAIKAKTLEARVNGEEGLAPVVFMGECVLEIGDEPKEMKAENGKPAGGLEITESATATDEKNKQTPKKGKN